MMMFSKPQESHSSATYTVSDEKYLSAKEIAKLLGITGARVRQLAGTREDPSQVFGSPKKSEGERGFKWPARSVYNYAIEHGYGVENLPAFLPTASRTRYIYRPDLSGLRTLQRFNTELKVWVFTFIENFRSGTGKNSRDYFYSLHLMLPIEDERFLTAQAAEDLFEGNEATLRYGDARPILITMSVLEESFSYPFMVTKEFGAPGWEEKKLEVDEVSDLIEAVGWNYMPVWHEGTASVGSMASWQPNVVQKISVPYSWSKLWALYKYAAMKSQDSMANADSWCAFAEGLYHLGFEFKLESMARMELQEPYGWGAQVNFPERMHHSKMDRNVGYEAALEELLGGSNQPVVLAETARNYYGDHQFSRPQSVNWENAGERLRKAIERTGEDVLPEKLASPRLKALVEHHQTSFEGEAPTAVLKVSQGFVAISESGVTGIAWFGDIDKSIHARDYLQDTWPSTINSVVLGKSKEDGSIWAWALTVDERPSQLPTRLPFGLEVVNILGCICGVEDVPHNRKVHRVLNQLELGRRYEFSAEDFMDLFVQEREG